MSLIGQSLKQKVQNEEEEKKKAEAVQDDADSYYEEDYDGNEDEEDEEEKETKKKGVNLKEVFSYLLPTFLFKWGGEIELEPDLQDIQNYCDQYQEESFILQSFARIMKVDVNAMGAASEGERKKGTRHEVMNYLVNEVGREVEFTWKSSLFFI